MRGVRVTVSGTGIQGAGRLVCIEPLSPEDPSAAVLERWRAAAGGVGAAPEPDVRWRPAGSSSSAPVGPDAVGGSGGGASGGMKALPEDVSKWLVLGIESSCDDTAAAVVAGDGTVRAHRIASQVGCLASSSPHPLPASCAC